MRSSLALAYWRGELFPIIAQLIDLRILERIEGRLFVRERRKKQPAPPPTFWSRLRSTGPREFKTKTRARRFQRLTLEMLST